MSIIEVLVPAIIGLTIGFTSNNPNNNEPAHIQILGIITAAIIITYPIQLTIQMFI